MGKEGHLGRHTKDIVALTVSIMSGCDYCIGVYNEAVKRAGLNNQALLELYEVIDLYSGLNRLNIGRQRPTNNPGMVAAVPGELSWPLEPKQENV